MEDFKITKIEELVWMVMRPKSFPCFICGEEEAVWKVEVEDNGVRGRLVVGSACMGYDKVKEFWRGSFRRDEKGEK